MKKVLLTFIILCLILVTIPQFVLSERAILINEEMDKSLNNNHKDYFNCYIKTSKEGVDGDAYLFPGYFISCFGHGANVKRACGVLIALQYITGYIIFNNDSYYGNWKIAFIFLFDGNFENYFEKAYRVFDMNGTAKFVRVYYS